MKRVRYSLILAIGACLLSFATLHASPNDAPGKPSPDKVLSWLIEGNARFVQGKSVHPHADSSRIALADTENQGKHALATILSCSDSRVPPEIVFDTGIMDLFIVRVAGNVANTDEIGTVEYGLCHVNTPLLVVLGHTQCGAVTAVTQEVTGHGHPLERNIPPLVAPIVPAVKRAMADHPDLKGDALVKSAIEANVWEVIKNIFLKSPAVRDLVKNGKVKVVGAIYDMHTGSVNWLGADKVAAIVKEAEASPERALNAMYDKNAPEGDKSSEQSSPAKAKELAVMLDAKTGAAAADMKEVKSKVDSLAAQLKAISENAKTAATEAGAETVKAVSSDMKGIKSGLEAKFVSFESTANIVYWLMISLMAVSVMCFVWILIKLGSIGAEQEQLRSELSKKIDNLNKK